MPEGVVSWWAWTRRDLEGGWEMSRSEQFPGSAELALAAERDKAAWDGMVKKATTDMEFRSQLLANPVRTLREEGIRVPDGLQVTVLEFDPKHAYFFMPPPAHVQG
jgi:hypothetical protein